MEATLLSHRLDRLRSTPGRVTRPAPAKIDHAPALAAALGGTAAGGVVVLEASFELPVDRIALAALPFGFPADGPLVCLDLETTGLATASGTLAFLVGLGWWEAERIVVRQLLLPDHAEEGSLLDALESSIPPDARLVTYNGRSFDWPLIVARYRMHRRAPPRVAGHIDLLPIARKLWRHRAGSARLSVIEQEVCQVRRFDDLPGAFIPERYFGYLRSREAELLRAPVDHNRQDIVSLGQLVTTLAGLVARDSWTQIPAGDLFGLGRANARRGMLDVALECLEAALSSDRWLNVNPYGAALHREISAERARLLARVGRRDEAVVAWHDIARRGGPGAAAAWLHIARYREHVTRDVRGALEACNEAAAVAGRARAWGNPLLSVERDLERRLPRLMRLSFRRRPLNRAA